MSSKRAIRRRSCDGKVRHETHAAAVAAMDRLRNSGKGRLSGYASAYRCTFCNGWHWGHGRGRNHRKRLKRAGGAARASA